MGALHEDPALLPDAVEEIPRYAYPNQMAIRRFPTEDVDISGTRIPLGDTVMLCIASAHATRSATPSLTASTSTARTRPTRRRDTEPTNCLGAPLARLEDPHRNWAPCCDTAHSSPSTYLRTSSAGGRTSAATPSRNCRSQPANSLKPLDSCEPFPPTTTRTGRPKSLELVTRSCECALVGRDQWDDSAVREV